ncbi:hypothetical protein M404DRAFT_558095 [Pisolithus tinctorius Marx 270]|uniref:Uncharacterized protein n=1 Tax=Pisolithus tinctorius Marx 270 TaxID=870435 RepID=A0A0C3NTU9_PISTI|nr:hypothetical protein M404DRAFT_558095 [Pisolithus tinctorius Marx 270]
MINPFRSRWPSAHNTAASGRQPINRMRYLSKQHSMQNRVRPVSVEAFFYTTPVLHCPAFHLLPRSLCPTTTSMSPTRTSMK